MHWGVYSISWSFSSEEASCGLQKLEHMGNYVSETDIGGTYSDQRQTLFMMLLERGNMIRLKCSSRSTIKEISFCINLVNSHDKTIEKKPNPNNNPKLKLFPVSEYKIYNIRTHGQANYDLAVNVTENFKQNKQISSQACQGKETARSCEKECYGLEVTWCDAGCAFDYDTLGDCKDMPFGFVNMNGEEGIVNPCFFLQLETEEYWSPDSSDSWQYTLQYNSPPRLDERDQFFLDCVAEIDSSVGLYSEIVEMLNDEKYTSFAFPPPTQNWLIEERQYFLENKKIAEDIDGLSEIIDAIPKKIPELYPEFFDGLKMIKKLRDNSTKYLSYEDKYKNAKFEKLRQKYLHKLTNSKISTFGNVVGFLRTLDSLEQEAAVNLYQELTKLKDFNENEIQDICITVFGNYNSNFEPWQCTNITKDNFESFFEILELTEYIEPDDRIPEEGSEVEKYMMAIEQWYPTNILAHNQQLVEKILSYVDIDDLQKFVKMRNLVKKYISYKNNVRVTHYPESQGYPKKYFPMMGYEESPVVAIKLHLQENER